MVGERFAGRMQAPHAKFLVPPTRHLQQTNAALKRGLLEKVQCMLRSRTRMERADRLQMTSDPVAPRLPSCRSLQMDWRGMQEKCLEGHVQRTLFPSIERLPYLAATTMSPTRTTRRRASALLSLARMTRYRIGRTGILQGALSSLESMTMSLIGMKTGEYISVRFLCT